jgi:hypothetical protein
LLLPFTRRDVRAIAVAVAFYALIVLLGALREYRLLYEIKSSLLVQNKTT